MAFWFRYSLNEGSILPAKDFPLDSTYAATAAPGDVVRLNASGNLVKALTTDTTVLGVLDGVSYDGVGVTPTKGKVRVSPDAIYEATKVGAGALIAGTAYGIDGSSNVDTADTTTLIVKIVGTSGTTGNPLVVITARQLV
jgi:hypothetical protein